MRAVKPLGAVSVAVPDSDTRVREALSFLPVIAELGASLSTSFRLSAWATVVGAGGDSVPKPGPPHGMSKDCTSPRQIVTCWVSKTLPVASSQVSVQASRLPALYSNGRVDGVTTQSKTLLAGTFVVYSSLSSSSCTSPGLMQLSSTVVTLRSLGEAISQTGLVEVLNVFFSRRIRPAGARPISVEKSGRTAASWAMRVSALRRPRPARLPDPVHCSTTARSYETWKLPPSPASGPISIV